MTTGTTWRTASGTAHAARWADRWAEGAHFAMCNPRVTLGDLAEDEPRCEECRLSVEAQRLPVIVVETNLEGCDAG